MRCESASTATISGFARSTPARSACSFFAAGSVICSVCQRALVARHSAGTAGATGSRGGARAGSFTAPAEWQVLPGQMPVPCGDELPHTVEQLVLLAHAMPYLRCTALGRQGLQMWQGLDAFATNEFAAALEAGAATIEDLRSFVLVHKVVFMTESIAGKNEKARQRMFAQRAAIGWQTTGAGGSG